DLVGLPKDRAYLYRSRWNKSESTLHILPHWNMFDRMGLITPVHIYTSFDRVELFLNGRSQGVKCKNGDYRICFENVVFEPGELRVDALDKSGKVLKSAFRRTA
ncbi:MAG: DUF4982 domain-containing protein, partial [Victivallaceae bacterium]